MVILSSDQVFQCKLFITLDKINTTFDLISKKTI